MLAELFRNLEITKKGKMKIPNQEKNYANYTELSIKLVSYCREKYLGSDFKVEEIVSESRDADGGGGDAVRSERLRLRSTRLATIGI